MMQNSQAYTADVPEAVTGQEMRANEFHALEQVTTILRQARDTGSVEKSAKGIALQHRLWNAFLEDLSAPGNALPVELRQQLTNIGAVVLQNTDTVEGGGPDFDFHINVNEAIMEGLQGV